MTLRGLAFVVSVNLHRRHLDAGQRAMVAARMAETRHSGRRTDLETSRSYEEITIVEAAQVLNVSEASTYAAAAVLESGTPFGVTWKYEAEAEGEAGHAA